MWNRPPKTAGELHVTRREDGRSELQVLHKVELGDSREHVNRLVDVGEAPEGGFPSWSLRARDVLRDTKGPRQNR